MTTILIKKKDTAGAPTAGDLTNAAGGTEIAVNTATKRIYTKDSGGNVVELGTNAGSSTIDALTVVTSETLSFGTASTALALDASKNIVSVTNTGTGNNVLATSPTLVTPILGTPTSGTLTNATGLPLSTGVTGTLVTTNGGTGLTSFTAGDLTYYAAGTLLSKLGIGTAGQILTVNSGATAPQWSSLSGVAVTTISGGTTGLTPATATSGAVTLAGTLIVGNGGTGATTLTGVLKGNGTSAFTAATAGTDYVAPGTATTFTALQTFAGTSSNADLKTSNILETATISATAATGTINFDTTTQSVLYYTTNASGNFTVNFRGSSGTTQNTIMATGESLSATFLVTNGATAYYNSAVTIDGSSVTPKWQGGTAPTSGNASAIDSYTYVIIKTGSAAFTVLASVTKFA